MQYSKNQKTVDKNDFFTVKDVSEKKGFFNRLIFLLNKHFSETEQEYYNRQNTINWLKENTKYGESGLESLDVNGNVKIVNLLWPVFKVSVFSSISSIFLMLFLSFIKGNLLFYGSLYLMVITLFLIFQCGGSLIMYYMDLKKEKEGSFFKNKINIFKRVLAGEEISVQELYENRLLKIPGER